MRAPWRSGKKSGARIALFYTVDFQTRLQSALRYTNPGAIEALKTRVRESVRLDGWFNAITGFGGRKDKTQAGEVCPPRILQNIEAMWLFHGSDLARKVAELLPSEAMRLAWETGAPRVDRYLRRRGHFARFLDAWIWGRVYGRSALFLAFKDSLGDYDKPLDDRLIRTGDLLYVEAVEGIDLTVAKRDYRQGSLSFNQPTHYFISSPNGDHVGQSIHASRFIFFGGPRTGTRVKVRRDGADVSVYQAIFELLRDVDASWRGVQFLMSDLSQAVFKIKGLTGMIANGQKDLVTDRMEIVDLARSIARAVVIDADGEDFTHVGAANVTGIEGLLTMIFQRFAGAANVPFTVLFGISPAGLNATGESDRRIFQATAAVHRAEVEPQAERFSRVVARHLGIDPRAVCVSWPDLWEMTDAERADIDLKRAQAAQTRIAAGMSDGDEERKLWVTGEDPAEAIDLTPVPEGLAEQPVESATAIEPGSIWIDTEDGHRLEVASVGDGRVYYTDKNSDTPERQWKWSVGYFLERCRLAPPALAADKPPAPPAPGAPPAATPPAPGQ